MRHFEISQDIFSCIGTGTAVLSYLRCLFTRVKFNGSPSRKAPHEIDADLPKSIQKFQGFAFRGLVTLPVVWKS
jgi:hypothetical protein